MTGVQTCALPISEVGRDKATLEQFFDLLGEERSHLVKLVSADAAEWIATVVAERCPNATLCADAFHMVSVRHEALCIRRRARDPPRWAVAAVR